MPDPAIFAVMVPAVILVGLSKGGFSGLSLLSLPLMALALSPVRAAAIMLPILMVQDVVSVWSFRRDVDRRNLAILLPPACLGILAGYLLAARVSEAAVALAVGLISVAFSLRRLIVADERTAAPKPAGLAAGGVWGFAAGFTSMIAHAGGPPFQIYLLPQKLPRDVFVGTGAVFFAIVNAIKVPPYLLLGQFTTENLVISASLFPVAILATIAGVRLVRMVQPDRFYTIVYGLLLCVGAKLVWDGGRALMG